jgi:hypothetical protein
VTGRLPTGPPRQSEGSTEPPHPALPRRRTLARLDPAIDLGAMQARLNGSSAMQKCRGPQHAPPMERIRARRSNSSRAAPIAIAGSEAVVLDERRNSGEGVARPHFRWRGRHCSEASGARRAGRRRTGLSLDRRLSRSTKNEPAPRVTDRTIARRLQLALGRVHRPACPSGQSNWCAPESRPRPKIVTPGVPLRASESLDLAGERLSNVPMCRFTGQKCVIEPDTDALEATKRSPSTRHASDNRHLVSRHDAFNLFKS